MDFIEYNEKALRTANTQLTWEKQVTNCGLGIVSEGGEIADHIKKTFFHGHTLDVDKVMYEIGDVLFYLNWLSDLIGYSLEEIATLNIEKLRKRYPEKFSSEASINRVD